MATIGHFRPVADGYEGTISTLNFARKVRFVANDQKKGERSPDFFVKTGRCDLGVAWREESKGDEPKRYLRVLLQAVRPKSPQQRRREQRTLVSVVGEA